MSFPPKHIGFDLIKGIPSGGPNQIPDFYPAFFTINFGCSSDMKSWTIFSNVFPSNIVIYRAPSNSKLWIRNELLETFFEIFIFKPQVAIEFDNVIPIIFSYNIVPFVQSFDYTAPRFSVSSVFTLYNMDPFELPGILF